MCETGQYVFEVAKEQASPANEKARQPMTSTVTETLEGIEKFEIPKPTVTEAEARLLQSDGIISSEDTPYAVTQQ